MAKEIQKIIPEEFIPEVGGRTITIEGKNYLEHHDVMYTFYRRSQGELSPFFLALRDKKRLLGCKCTRCGIVRVPPMATHCPDCDFAPTELVEVGDVGKMLHTPPITYFANSIFQKQVPFGRGRVVLNGSDTALSINLYTTSGILVPGIYKMGTEVKVIFRDRREGLITDIFGIPAAELKPSQIRKKGLTESELDWEAARAPDVPGSTPENTSRLKEILVRIGKIIKEMNRTPRARKDIADWKRAIQVNTAGGKFVIRIDNGTIDLSSGIVKSPDFTMVAQDPEVILKGLAYEGSLTESIMNGNLWISKNVEFMTVFKLERMARSLARSKKRKA